jgi:exopolyphosphatase/guanosine-5'-triphosphate,3'-diphosphate pyrophosphatase
MLEFAALLHDVGLYVSHRRHHYHSQYLISYGEILRGFTPEEIQATAALARFHKGALPKLSSPELGELSSSARERVIGLAAILRVADALDRSHHGIVRAIRVSRDGPRVVVRLDAEGHDAELELWAAERKGDLWEKFFGHPLEFRLMESRTHRHRRRMSSVRAGYSALHPA